MARSQTRTFDTALERGAFDRVYLFHGDEEFLKEEKIRALIARATDAGTRDFNLDVWRGAETDASSLVLALDALPLMAERRVLILRDVTAMKKDARVVLDRYLEQPSADVILVLVASAGAKVDDGITRRAVAVEFRPLDDEGLANWVLRQVQKLGGAISPSAVKLLCASTGNDLPLLTGEIDKLLSYTRGAEIDAAAVTAIVGVREDETLGHFLDLLAAREAIGAVSILGRVLSQPKTTGVSLVMALTTQTLALGFALAARDSGSPQHRMESELFGLLKENPSSVVGRPWGEGVKCWVRCLRYWDNRSVDNALRQLVAADAALKDTRVSSEEQVLGSLILSLAPQARQRTVI
jgi:DNA polymerase-3 subunit delta